MSVLSIVLLQALALSTAVGTVMMLASLAATRRRVRWSGHIKHQLLLSSLVTSAGALLVTIIVPPAFDGPFALMTSPSRPAASGSSDRVMEFYTFSAAGKFPGMAPPAATAPTAPAPETPRRASRWASALLLLWLSGAVVSLARLARERRRVLRMVHEATPVGDPLLAARLEELTVWSGISHPVRLLRHPDVEIPSVIGTAHPAILLPAGFERLDVATWDMVLLHELAHVRRSDARASLVGEAAAALFWFNPVARLTTRRMRDLQEVAADSCVVSGGVRPSAYARFLLDTWRMMTTSAGVASSGGHSIVGRRPMDTRLRLILDRRSRHQRPSRLLVIASTLPFLLCGLALPWAAPAAVDAVAQSGSQRPSGHGEIDRGILNQAALDARLRPVFINTMTDRYVAGAAIAVVHEGKVVYEQGFGRREAFRELPVDSRKTIWRIGSVTKVLTGVAVMQLVERKLLDLNEDVNRYLTEFKIHSWFDEPIRVRHLLTHTAGFDQIGLGRHAESLAAVRPLGEFLEESLHPIRPPGEVSAYDTYGMTLAGYLVEQVSGMSYERYLKANVFEPLGMSRSGITVPQTLRDDVAVGYGFAGAWEAEPWEYMNTAPASSVNATVDDMARFMIMMLEGGRFEGHQVLQPASVRAMLSRQFTNDPDQPGYGFTFFEDRSFGLPAFSHGGSMAGFGCFMYLVPQERLGVFIATNQESGALQNAVVSTILDGLFPDRPTAPPLRPRLDAPVDLSPFTGVYASNVYHHADPTTGWRIRPFELKADPGGGLLFDGAPAFPVGPLSFQRDDGLLLTFRENERGDISHMFVNQTVYEHLRR